MLYIDPDHCIDCDACRPECPVDAIFPDTRTPALWQHYVALNAERSAALRETVHIVDRKEPKRGAGCQAAGR